MAVVASLSHGIAAQNESDIGSGFYRIQRPNANFTGDTKPTPPNPTPAPTNDEFSATASRRPIRGDIAVVTYQNPNLLAEFSCAFEYDGDNWIVAAEFIDGNLIAAGSVFSRVGFGAGIPVSSLDDILDWSVDPDFPRLAADATYNGSYLGFVNNPDDLQASAANPTQEILLVGDQNDHLFWNGETLTLSGITIEDPTILITTPEPDGTGEWDAGTTYELGDIVSFGGQVYVALQETTGNDPTNSPDFWQASETVAPSVTIATAQPATRTHGDLWYDSSIGRLFLYYATDPVADPTVGTWADVTKN